MLTIDMSYAAGRNGRSGWELRKPAPILDAPETAHDAMRYAAALAGLSGHQLMQREMDVYTAWVYSMDRWYRRTVSETKALEKARDLIEAERARRDPKYGLLLKEKRA